MVGGSKSSGVKASALSVSGGSMTTGIELTAASSKVGLCTSQAPSLGVGYGLDNASGTATKNTRTPQSTPASERTWVEIRSAEIVARNARMSTPARLSGDNQSPRAGETDATTLTRTLKTRRPGA